MPWQLQIQLQRELSRLVTHLLGTEAIDAELRADHHREEAEEGEVLIRVRHNVLADDGAVEHTDEQHLDACDVPEAGLEAIDQLEESSMLVEQLLQAMLQLRSNARALLQVALQLPDEPAIVGSQAEDKPTVERVHAAGGAAEEGQHEDHEAAVEHVDLRAGHIVGQAAEARGEGLNAVPIASTSLTSRGTSWRAQTRPWHSNAATWRPVASAERRHWCRHT